MHTIWKNRNISLDTLNEMSVGTMTEALGIEFIEIAQDYLRVSMPVDKRTKQPYGVLHGGASAALVETIGSIASGLMIDSKKQSCVGISLNVNHVHVASEGNVHGIARPLHIGRSTHVWDVKIYDDDDELVAVGRLTVAVLNKRIGDDYDEEESHK